MRLGPIAGATLIVQDLQVSIDAYESLGMVLTERDRVPKQRALDMGDSALIDAPRARLACPADSWADSWLVIIEASQALASPSFGRRGWLALALPVADLDLVRTRLSDSAFVLAPSAEDEFNDHGRAQALIGPNAELLYLLQFESTGPSRLAAPRCPIDRPCAVALGAQQPATALAFYEGLGLLDRLHTRWSPSALERGEQNGERRALAIGQLAGAHALLIDAVPFLPAADATLRLGWRLISFARSDARLKRLAGAQDPSARILAGPEGEGIELL